MAQLRTHENKRHLEVPGQDDMLGKCALVFNVCSHCEHIETQSARHVSLEQTGALQATLFEGESRMLNAGTICDAALLRPDSELTAQQGVNLLSALIRARLSIAHLTEVGQRLARPSVLNSLIQTDAGINLVCSCISKLVSFHCSGMCLLKLLYNC